jgi:AraC family transcriptional regulator
LRIDDTLGVPGAGRDRLKEFLDAVLDGTGEGRPSKLDDMAGAAASSSFHFARLLSRDTGEPPVSMRRRVLLERAAWQLMGGGPVTDAAFGAGYESVEGFSRAYARAFGHPPSIPATGYWLPAPNGIHFHPPASMWADSREPTVNPVMDTLVRHDLDDTRSLLVVAKSIPAAEYGAERLRQTTLLSWHGPEESIAAVLENHVWTKEVWTAAIEGHDVPERDERADAIALLERHDAVAPRWLAAVREIERRGAWEDVMIDALCEPPESFVVGAVVAHVLTYSAGRRLVVRSMLRAAGVEVDDGDPIDWVRARIENAGGRP